MTGNVLPVAILNTSIATMYGTYSLEPLSLDEARELVKGDIISAVGHEATAAVLTALLGREIPVNRVAFRQQPGQTALVFKLHGRPPEGRVLTVAEIEETGYDLMCLYRHSGADGLINPPVDELPDGTT